MNHLIGQQFMSLKSVAHWYIIYFTLSKIYNNLSFESRYFISKFPISFASYASCEYHGDIYDMVRPAIEKDGLDCECVGGGRILHDSEKKTIQVFGYSQGFGKADHTISVGILEKKYADYKITWSDEGY